MARVAAIVVVVLAAAWGGLWWYTQSWLQNLLVSTASMKTTSDGSSTVDYDSVSKGTNPLVASATLNNVRWSLNAPGAGVPVAVGLAQIELWISPLNPLVMHVGLPNHIYINTPRVNGALNFGSIAVDTQLDPQALLNRKLYPLTSEMLVIQNMDFVAGNGDLVLLHIDSIIGKEGFNPKAGPAQTAFEAQDSADGIALSPALVLLAHVPFGGKIAHLGFNATLSGPVNWNGEMEKLRTAPLSEQQRRQMLIQTTHQWAAGGGHGKVKLVLELGPSTLTADSTISFDGKAQPNGTADIRANHLDNFTAALTNAYPELQPSISTLETELSPYLRTTDADGQVLTLNIAYGKDGVMVNGTKRTDMPPIDWTALENPPASVPQAPGDGSGAAIAAP